MRFGTQELQQYTRIEEQFHFDLRSQLDLVQQCLIDNVWNIPMAHGISNYKIEIINALENYFVTIVQKPEGKKYSCYAVLFRPQVGVHSTRDEVKIAIMGCERQISYKGFYSLDEAFSAIRANVGPNYFLSTSLKFGRYIEPDKTYVEAATSSLNKGKEHSEISTKLTFEKNLWDTQIHSHQT